MNLLEQIHESLVNNKANHAFCIKGSFYSYESLYGRICKIVDLLHKKGLDSSRNRNVGIITNNDIETYASLIGCWFLGFAYVPLNPSIPRERNKVIIREAGIQWILSSAKNFREIGTEDPEVDIILTSDEVDQRFEHLVIPSFDEERNAYIIFTSGSTGAPKGVPVTQPNVASFIENFNSTKFEIESTDRCLQMFELSFDVSISSFLIPLLRGACVYPVGDDGIRYIQVLKLIQQYELTSIQIVPSVIRLAGSLLKRLKFPWVRNCIVTGEATSTDLLPELRFCMENARIYNFYGPTEATIYCSFYECKTQQEKNYLGMLSIGKAMGNMKLLILDEHQNEVPKKIKGELYIGGTQLSIGYLNNSFQSKESFVILTNMEGEIFYKSGDMAYKDEDEDIYYCGRFDNQVKIQGFRVELGEIEYLVRDKFEINNAVLIVDSKNNSSELMLILETDQSTDNETILNYLKHKLPQYMIPAAIRVLKEFPLTSSGKTDRKKIREVISNAV